MELSNKEKLKLLRKLRKWNIWNNLILTFLGIKIVEGLCMLLEKNTKYFSMDLRFLIPELYNNKISQFPLFWWDASTKQKFFIERHKAINKTIKDVKKQIYHLG
jgi:hypothetical protein